MEERKEGSMDALRKPGMGVWNIVRFNWHFYLIAVGTLILAGIAVQFFPPDIQWLGWFAIIAAAAGALVSLLVSWYVYDLSGFYSLNWLDMLPQQGNVINAHAGFDETSALIHTKFPDIRLRVIDFYDPEKHTEISIERARKVYPAFQGTMNVSTLAFPFSDASSDAVLHILSAHEIRDPGERVMFFKECRRVMTTDGKMVVVEHLRDLPNFLAYSVGFFHFHSRGSWMQCFRAAGLRLSEERKINPFIHCFILTRDGDPL